MGKLVHLSTVLFKFGIDRRVGLYLHQWVGPLMLLRTRRRRWRELNLNHLRWRWWR